MPEGDPVAQVAHQPGDNPAETLQVVEERAVIRKRKNLTNGVRVRTLVREDEEVIDALLHTEQAEVERVALDRWVEEPVPVRQEGATTVITLHEEVRDPGRRLADLACQAWWTAGQKDARRLAGQSGWIFGYQIGDERQLNRPGDHQRCRRHKDPSGDRESIRRHDIRGSSA
jgi:hypothetical protein